MADSYVVHSVAPEPFRLRLQDGTVVETTLQGLVRGCSFTRRQSRERRVGGLGDDRRQSCCRDNRTA